MNLFVLMPFNPEHDKLFKVVFQEKLAIEGLKIGRADTNANHVNILEDILRGIVEADLIVADLTGLNPNVMYELGVAHALAKSVIHITQDVSTIPFDLKSYRVITYSEGDYHSIFRLIDELKSSIERLKEGTIRFGNPVKDYVDKGSNVRPSTPGENVPMVLNENSARLEVPDEEDRPGLLDTFLKLETAQEIYTTALAEVNASLERFTVELDAKANEMSGMSHSGPVGFAPKVRIFNEVSTIIRRHGEDLDSKGRPILELAKVLEDAVEFRDLWLASMDLQSRAELRSVFGDMGHLTADVARSLDEMISTMHSFKDYSKEIRSSIKFTSKHMSEISGAIASCSRSATLMVEAIDSL